MSENVYQDNNYRRRRVQRLKKLIVCLFVLFLLVPNVCCVILFVRVHMLNRKLEDLSLQMERFMQVTEEWQNRLDEEKLRQENGTEQENGEEASAVSGNAVTDAEPLEEQPRHKVYLTFDDGPSIYTEEILDILKEYDLKATFFVVGKEDEASREVLQRIVEEGHTLGMHSYSHKYRELYQSVDAFSEDFHKLQDYLYEVTGVRSMYYRFPGGSSNTVSTISMQEFADYLNEEGVTFYDWNISSGDAASRPPSKETLVANSTDDISRWETSIILMHDSAEKHTTVEALPEIIEKILAMEDTVILPITEETKPVQHIHIETNENDDN